MVLLDYFRILKALIVLFLLFVCMNYVPNQNRKVLKETLEGFNSDECENNIEMSTLFQNDCLSFGSSSKSSPHSSVTFLHTIEIRGSTEGPCDLQVKLVIIQ